MLLPTGVSTVGDPCDLCKAEQPAGKITYLSYNPSFFDQLPSPQLLGMSLSKISSKVSGFPM